MHPDRLFPSDPSTRNLSRELYERVDPHLFSDPNATFGTPADLFIIPDHYVTRSDRQATIVFK